MDDINGSLDQLEERLKYFQAIVQYLDSSGNLNLLKAQCIKYGKSKCLVYTFKLLVSLSELCESNANLGNLLIQHPVEAAKCFQEVIYKTILVLNLLPSDLSLSQVAVILRLSALPALVNMNIVHSARCLSQVYNTGVLCRLVGVVTGISAVSKYTQSVRYFCPETDCDGYRGNHFIRIHTPGASEAQTVRKDFKCTFCTSVLVEEKSSRTLSDRLVVEVVPEEIMASLSSQLHHGSRGQVVPVFVRDDLTKLLEIGDAYEIIGSVRRDINEDTITMTMEANNIQKVKRNVSVQKLLQTIPRNVLNLYKDRKSSPWSFVLTLAYLFGGDVCPPGSYFSLKLAILLSLMSHRDGKAKPVHILAVGSDTEMLSRLLQFGQRFKESNTNLTTGQCLDGHVIQDRYNHGSYFVEGGVLHLSQAGVCNVGDVNRLKKTTRDQLQSAMNNGKITTTVGSKFTGGLPQLLEQSLKTRIWAYSDPSICRKKPQHDELFVTCDTGDIPKHLLDAFSLLCFTECKDYSYGDDIPLKIMVNILESAMVSTENMGTSLPVTAEDFSQFLRFADRLQPKFTKEAETLINSYYLTCRKSRSSDSVTVPVSAAQALLSLSYGHAKLALRSEVTIDDALMAIKLYEESLTARFGYSALGVQPVPSISSDSIQSHLGPQNDKDMAQFHRNLLKYCSLASCLEE